MWRSLSIRTQLTILMVMLLAIVASGTFSLVYWSDVRERQTIAIEQAETLGRSLNNDLLRAVVSINAATLSDLSFRISGFKSVDALQIYDASEQAIFQYGDSELVGKINTMDLVQDKPQFAKSGRLFIKLPVLADATRLGSVVIVINPSQYHTRLKENLYTLLWIFPVVLIIGVLAAWRMSHSYTEPFKKLANAMQASNISTRRFEKVNTNQRNEIGQLCEGYNEMIDEVEKTTEKLFYQSRHDSLTGLFNRFAIETEIRKVLQNKKYDQNVLFNIDLDNFKAINDTVGHAAGDELLQLVAHACIQLLPQDAVIARVGADDYFVLLKNTNQEQGVKLANDILEKFRDFRFVWQGQTFSVSASLGLIAFKPFEYTLLELIKDLDLAFYAAKSKGLNKLHVYQTDKSNEEIISSDIQMAGYIKEALKEGPSRFELYAQDIVPLQTESDKFSYEILIRMFDSNGEFLAPYQFLSTAERYQLMVDIDIHVFSSYVNYIIKKPAHLERLHSAHINLAGGTLNHPDFQKCVKETIATVDFPWERLELEVTETSSIGDLVQAQEFIEYCKQHKIGFALDDFGTGMSSFEYLKNLPFDIVKIDGSFVRDMLTDPVDHAMIRYTHEISKLRNQKTVAEFVETKEMVDELREIGITYGQGYYLGKPRPLKEWCE